MSSVRLFALSALLPLSFACQTALAAQAGGAPQVRSAGILPAANRAIELRVADSSSDSLAYLIDQLGAATGVAFTATPPVRQMLEASRSGVAASVTIPAAEAWPWVEGLLAHQGFALGAVSTRAPHLIAVYGPPQRDGSSSRVALRVAETKLDPLEEHPALLIQTTLELPYADVRQLSNSMRALLNDNAGSLTLVPAGSTNSVVLQGRAREVLQMTVLLREINELAGQGSAAQEQAGAPGQESQPGAQAPLR